MIQEANASRRKARGINNPLDREIEVEGTNAAITC